MAGTFAFVIRFLHIVSGVMWIGGLFLWAMVITPRIMRNGPPQIRLPFMDAVIGGVTRYFNTAAAVTIVTGLWTMGLLGGWDLADEFRGAGEMPAAWGIGLGVGLASAIALGLLGTLVVQPSARKLIAAMKAATPGSPPPPEVQALGKRMGMASMAGLLLGTIALGAMAWAVNYVR